MKGAIANAHQRAEIQGGDVKRILIKKGCHSVNSDECSHDRSDPTSKHR